MSLALVPFTALPIIETQAGDVFGLYSDKRHFHYRRTGFILNQICSSMPVCVRQSMLVFPYPALAAPRKSKAMKQVAGTMLSGSCPVSRTFAAFAQFGSDLSTAPPRPNSDRGARLCRAAEAAPIPAHASPGTGLPQSGQPPMATWMTCRSRISAVSESRYADLYP